MVSAKLVAEYFLAINDDEAGEGLSNLKLQKLLYYAQGLHLALHDQPLFLNPIVAWQHGPVVKEIYDLYSCHGSQPIPRPEEVDFSSLSPQTREVLQEVFQVFGQFSAWRLREMTHSEPPWQNTRTNAEISREKLKEYFKTQLI